MRDAIRALLVAASFLLLSSPALYGLTGFAFLTATIQLVAVIFLLTVSWDRFDARVDREFRVDGRIAGPIVAVAAGLVVFIACRVWLRHILNAPSDAPGAQTVLIQSSVRRLLQGRDPYAIAQGMSPAGPLLLVPYIGPFLLRVDLRFASLVGELFVPVATAIVAAALATQGRAVGAVAWTAASAIIVSDLSAERFAAFAHTPVYWPLLAALTWSAARQHWRAAAFLCGLLIATRWSMIAIAPVVLIGAWGHGRPTFRRSSVLMIAAGAGPYLPFAILGWTALQSSVERAMHAPAAIDVVGVSGVLARAGFARFVTPLAIVTMAGVYAYAVQAMRRGHRTLPSIPAALFAFHAVTPGTTSADYIDVFVLIAFASLIETPWMTLRSASRVWSVCLIGAALAVSAVALTDMQRDLQIDVGTPDARTFLYAGFADDEEAGRSFAWVDGNRAEVLLPRRSHRDAEITIECEPNLPTPTATQQMSIALNGVVLGTMHLREGWQTVVVPAPSRAWLIGVNELTLSFSSAASPLSLGLSTDPRKLSVAFDRISVKTK